MHRISIAALAALITLTVAADSASAERYRKRYTSRNDDAQARSADRVRANSLDPSGEYKYPDWARKALAPKGGGGGARG